MTIYFLLYAILLAVQLVISRLYLDDQKYQKIIAITITTTIVLLLGLRHPSVGGDLGYISPGVSRGYLSSFDYLAKCSWKEIISLNSYLNYEKGYILFNKFISIFSTNYSCLLMSSAIISLVPIGLLYYRQSINQLFSWIVYLGLPCFLITYSGLRQAIAVGIISYSIQLATEKKLIRFVVVVLLASLFHASAILCLVIYPVYQIRIEKNIRWATLAVPLACFMFKEKLFLLLSKLVKEGGRSLQANGAITLFLVFLLIYVFCTVFMDESNNETAGLLNIFLLACCCQAFGSVYMTAMRVGYYFMIPIGIALPNVIEGISNRYSRILSKYIIGFVFITYSLYAIMTTSWAMAYPYHFFWSDV